MTRECHLVEVTSRVVDPVLVGSRAFIDELQGRLAFVPHALEVVAIGPIASKWSAMAGARATEVAGDAHALRVIGSFFSSGPTRAEELASEVFGQALREAGSDLTVSDDRPVAVAAGEAADEALAAEREFGVFATPEAFATVVDLTSGANGAASPKVAGHAVFARMFAGGSHHGIPTMRGAYQVWDRIREDQRPTSGPDLTTETYERVVTHLDEMRDRLGRAPTPTEVNFAAWEMVHRGADPHTVPSMLDVERAGIVANRSIGVVRSSLGAPAVTERSQAYVGH